MEETTRTTTATASLVKDLLVWHWNCNGFTNKKAVLQLTRRPDVIMNQETHSEEMPKIPGYRSHDSPQNKRETSKGKGRGVCAFVRKWITFIEHELLDRSAIEHCAVEIITGKKKESIYLVNVYSNPAHGQQKFKALLHKASRLAGTDALVVCADFNAPNCEWGYINTTVKGRDLLQDANDLGLHLITDPAFPTRTGTSVARDTTPDVTFVKIDRVQGHTMEKHDPRPRQRPLHRGSCRAIGPPRSIRPMDTQTHELECISTDITGIIATHHGHRPMDDQHRRHNTRSYPRNHNGRTHRQSRQPPRPPTRGETVNPKTLAGAPHQ